MKIPIFEEIIAKDISIKGLVYLFSQKKMARQPIYISLHTIAPNQHQMAIDNIGEALLELRVHPHFPFVIYVITKANVKHDTIQISKTLDDLPSHFLKKAKRLKNKEINLLNKLTLIGEMVDNQDIYERCREMKTTFSYHRHLYNLCKEDQFYSDVLKQIHIEKRKL